MSAEELSVDVQLAFAGFELKVDERLPLEGITAVFGPSGSGKSTLLRAIAGFDTPDSGRVACGGDTWFDRGAGIDIPPHRRGAGFVFQHNCLFPHLDVAGNLDFADRRSRSRQGQSRADIIAALDLEPLMPRRVDSLSGGERQRVSLGRTMLTRPRILLLDEPLAALDRQRKSDILPYLEKLPRRFGVPTLYVSHDIDEIVELSDRALVLANGLIEFHGGIAEAIERLDLQTLAGRFDAGVLVEGRVTRHDRRLYATLVDLHGDTLTLPLVDRCREGQSIRLRIRSRDVAIATRRPEGISIRNVLPGSVLSVSETSSAGFAEVLVETRGARIRSRVTVAAAEELELAAGKSVFALIKSVTFER